MRWTAIVPVKGAGQRKTRLSGELSESERWSLTQQLFGHVTRVLAASADVGDVVVLSRARPEGWSGSFTPDAGRGLNAELRAAADRLGPRPLLVVHADLPLLSARDVAELIAQAATGFAIAPDRHGSGTNALALRDPRRFDFAFGEDSFARHCAAADGPPRIVRTTGLMVDIDTPDDLAAATALGFRFPASSGRTPADGARRKET